MIEANSYPINFIRCSTIQNDLYKLKNLYRILNNIHLVIPKKSDVPSQLPQGYVTLYLKCFKLWVKLPLQPYFVKLLSDLHLAPS